MTAIRDDVLSDPKYPVHRIAAQVRPYLEKLIEQFHPDQIVLFGSYAYGQPTPDSDVDLLVIKKIERTPTADATAIRRALRLLRHLIANLPLDILVRDPDDFRERVGRGAAFHSEIAQKGLLLA